jgi:hypothetical protein
MPWFLIYDETRRPCVAYFLLEGVQRRWSWVCPATVSETDATPEELSVKPKGRPPKIPAVKQAMRDKIKQGETTLEELNEKSGQELVDMFGAYAKDGAKIDTCRDALRELTLELRGKREK